MSSRNPESSLTQDQLLKLSGFRREEADALDAALAAGAIRSTEWPTSTELVTIYANEDGDDDTGDGLTYATGYRTLQRAALDLKPGGVPRNTRWIVDITNLGTETLPTGWTMPAIKAAAQLDQAVPSTINSWERFRGAVAVRATPKIHSIGTADATVVAADLVGSALVADADDGLLLATLSVARPSWAGAVITGFSKAMTAAATTDTLTVTAHGLETGAGPFQFTNSGGALPAGISTSTDYWVIVNGTNTLKLASSGPNSLKGTVVDVTDAGTGTHTMVSVAATQAGGALRGALLRSSVTSTVGQTDGVIVGSTDTAFLCTVSSQSPGAGGSAIVPTGPWTIMTRSARLEGTSNTLLGGNGTLNAFNMDSFTFAGIDFVNTGAATDPCVVVRSSCPAWAFMNCSFGNRAAFQGGGSFLSTFEACYFYGGSVAEFMGIKASMRKCFFYKMTTWNTIPDDGALWMQACYFDRCDPILKSNTYGLLTSPQQTMLTQVGLGMPVIMSHCRVANGTGNGLEVSGGGIIQYSTFRNCVSAAIKADYGARALRLVRVKGTGNAGIGLEIANGTQVVRDSNTTVTGVGGDYKVGTNAATATGVGWTALGSTGQENDFMCSTALVFADATFTAATTDIITFGAAHGLETGDGPFQVSNAGGALPTGLSAVTDYWFIRLSTTTGSLASSWANALAGIAVDITDAGTGTQTMADTTLTKTSPGSRSQGCRLITV